MLNTKKVSIINVRIGGIEAILKRIRFRFRVRYPTESFQTSAKSADSNPHLPPHTHQWMYRRDQSHPLRSVLAWIPFPRTTLPHIFVLYYVM